MSFLKWQPVDSHESPKIPNWTNEYAEHMRDHFECRMVNRENDENSIERRPTGKTEQHLLDEKIMKRASSVYNVLREFTHENVKVEPGEQVVVCNKYLRDNQDDTDDVCWRRLCRREAVYSLTHENYQTLIRRFARAREDRNTNFEAIRSRRNDRVEEERNHQSPNERVREDHRTRLQSPVDRARADPNASYDRIRSNRDEKVVDNRRRESPVGRARVDRDGTFERIRSYGDERAMGTRSRQESPIAKLKSRDRSINGYRDEKYRRESRSQSRSPRRQSVSPRQARSPRRYSRSPARRYVNIN